MMTVYKHGRLIRGIGKHSQNWLPGRTGHERSVLIPLGLATVLMSIFIKCNESGARTCTHTH